MIPNKCAQDEPCHQRPGRIQLRRLRGWPAPLGAVYVGRPTHWVNPYETAEEYREHVLPCLSTEDLRPLRGKMLMFRCAFDADCHADSLLEAVKLMAI